MLLAPIGNPEPRDCIPLDTPYIFLENGTQTEKMQFDTFPQKIQTGLFSEPMQQKKSCFDAAASKEENVKIDDYHIEARNENENNRNHR